MIDEENKKSENPHVTFKVGIEVGEGAAASLTTGRTSSSLQVYFGHYAGAIIFFINKYLWYR
jgi:hypothetical protein